MFRKLAMLGQFDDFEHEVQQEGDIDQTEQGWHKTAQTTCLKVHADDGDGEHQKTEQEKIVASIESTQIVAAYCHDGTAAEPQALHGLEPHLFEQLV